MRDAAVTRRPIRLKAILFTMCPVLSLCAAFRARSMTSLANRIGDQGSIARFDRRPTDGTSGLIASAESAKWPVVDAC